MGSIRDATGSEAAALADFADFAGRRVLEVGCGDGRLTSQIARDAVYVLGIDSEPDVIAEARKTIPTELADRIEFRAAKAEELTVPPPKFDIAFLSWSL